LQNDTHIERIEAKVMLSGARNEWTMKAMTRRRRRRRMMNV
jgi:hypothetical protein